MKMHLSHSTNEINAHFFTRFPFHCTDTSFEIMQNWKKQKYWKSEGIALHLNIYMKTGRIIIFPFKAETVELACQLS